MPQTIQRQKNDTFMHGSKVSLLKWDVAIYLYSTNLKGVSSMKLHRDLEVTQKTAWHTVSVRRGTRPTIRFIAPGRG